MSKNKKLLSSNRSLIRKIDYGSKITFNYNNKEIIGTLVEKSTTDNFTIARSVQRGQREYNKRFTYKYYLVSEIKTLK
jgi:hypothetical protein